MMDLTYQFSVEDAKKYGVDEAIMLYNFKFWLLKNKSNKKHIYDGRVWTYNSVKAFKELFPFWTSRQLERILNSLVKQEILLVGNYNKIAYDRTKWYSINDDFYKVEIAETTTSPNGEMSDTNISPNGEMDLTECVNGNNQTVKPIPNINTDIKPDTSTTRFCSSNDGRKNLDEVAFNTRLNLTKSMIDKVYSWNHERLLIALHIFKEQDGKYFALLEKIYKDDGNFVKNDKAYSVNPKSFNNFEPVDVDYEDLERKLLGWDTDQ